MQKDDSWPKEDSCGWGKKIKYFNSFLLDSILRLDSFLFNCEFRINYFHRNNKLPWCYQVARLCTNIITKKLLISFELITNTWILWINCHKAQICINFSNYEKNIWILNLSKKQKLFSWNFNKINIYILFTFTWQYLTYIFLISFNRCQPQWKYWQKRFWISYSGMDVDLYFSGLIYLLFIYCQPNR